MHLWIVGLPIRTCIILPYSLKVKLCLRVKRVSCLRPFADTGDHAGIKSSRVQTVVPSCTGQPLGATPQKPWRVGTKRTALPACCVSTNPNFFTIREGPPYRRKNAAKSAENLNVGSRNLRESLSQENLRRFFEKFLRHA
jgi:hypothetical protein